MPHGHSKDRAPDTHVEKQPAAPAPFTGPRTPGPLVIAEGTWRPTGDALKDYPKWPRDAAGNPLPISEAAKSGLDAISIDGVADR